MSVDTWVELIKHHYSLNDSLSFTGNQLLKALSSKQHRHLFTLMDADQSNVPKDHVSIFHDKYWPWTSTKCIYCFYATLKGNKPIKTEKPWFENVDLALDLLNKHQTWRQQEQQQLEKNTIDLAGSMQDQPPSKKWKLQPKTGELSCMSSMASEGGDAASSLPNPLLPPSLPLSLQPSQWPSLQPSPPIV